MNKPSKRYLLTRALVGAAFGGSGSFLLSGGQWGPTLVNAAVGWVIFPAWSLLAYRLYGRK